MTVRRCEDDDPIMEAFYSTTSRCEATPKIPGLKPSRSGYLFNPQTGGLTPLPDAPHGWVFEANGEIRPAREDEVTS